MRIKYLIISGLFILFHKMSAQDKQAYIQSYQDIAVAEMLRTGIPASVKLAQGMHESNCGASELARKANNHFGIKCGGDWSGKGFHKEDDDYRNGDLVKSCFREFDSAFESYVAHSDFLADPKKVQRYGGLFQLGPTDYKSWARGLSKAGYATDPNYADKLIRIIEENKLYMFDQGDASMMASARPGSSLGYDLIRYNNDVKYALAGVGETLSSMALRYDVNEKQLARYNDYTVSPNQPLAKGTKVYLQPKRSSFHGKQKYYVIKSGEDLRFVAQEFGVKLNNLARRNGIDVNQVPKPGQKIMLRGKAKTSVKTTNPYELPDAPSASPREEVSSTSSNSGRLTSEKNSPVSKNELSGMPDVHVSAGAHTVSKGDTLYSISRMYGLSIDDLKKRNNLSVDTIHVGQKLQVQ